MRIVDPAGFCDRQVPVLSTLGRGPKGEKGDTGDTVYPTFADEPWSIDTAYRKLTVVLHEGNSYTAKQDVPVGIDISNTDFWVETGNYNEQIEQYRLEVMQKPFTFETVEAMQDAHDLLHVGAICHTNGFHKSGDGGAAWYVITDSGDVNNKDVIQCGPTLIANLVITEPFVTPEMFGAYGDGTEVATEVLEYVVSEYDYIIANGTYLIDSPLTLSKNMQLFICNGCINYDGTDTAVKITSSDNSKYVFQNIDAPNGNAITVSQVGLPYSQLVGYFYLEIGSIDCGKNGLQFLAGNHGVLDINVRITNRIRAAENGVYIHAGSSSSSSAPSYVGEILIEGGLIDGLASYGLYLDATQGYEITGITLQDCSMEHSANAIMHAGGLIVGCVYNNLRVAEIGGTWLNINGNTRNCVFKNEQSVALNKVINNSTALDLRAMIIDAPIATTGGLVCGEKLTLVAGAGVSIIKPNIDRVQNVSNAGYTWDTSKSIPTMLIFGHGSAVITLADIPFLNIYGLTELHVYGFSDCTAKIIDNTTDNNTIIDFANYNASGFHCIKCTDGTSTATKYRVLY